MKITKEEQPSFVIIFCKYRKFLGEDLADFCIQGIGRK